MDNICRGSEWRKWDLHLHTPYGNIKGNGNYKGVSDEEFINKLKNEEISVVGLTNYFKFSDEDYKLADKMRDNGITTFMNLEIRLFNMNDENGVSDYHIIFSDELSKLEIDSFLANLDAIVSGRKKKLLSLDNKEIEFTASIDFDHLCDVLNYESLVLRGKYLKGFLSRGHGNSRTGKSRGYNVYERITSESDLVIHSSDFLDTLEKDKNYWLGKDNNSSKYVRALLQSSDAHCLDRIGSCSIQTSADHKNRVGVYEKDGKYYVEKPGFTWIKADTTFEGLKQILYEPDERIYYGLTKPNNKFEYMTIDYLRYNDDKIYFNDGLNCIIGGRGTGKSTLLNSIASYQNNPNFIEKDYHTFNEGEYDVVWSDGDKDTSRPVEFIPQEFMINLSNKSEKLNNLIYEIIAKKNYGNYEKAYKEEINNITNNLNNLMSDYFTLKNEKSELIKPEGDLQSAKQSREDLKEEIDKIRIENKFSEEDNKIYADSIKDIERLKSKIESDELGLNELEKLAKYDFSVNIELGGISETNLVDLKRTLKEIEAYSRGKWLDCINRIDSKIRDNIKLEKEELIKIENSDIYQKGKKLEKNNRFLNNYENKIKSHSEIIKNIEEYIEKRNTINKKLDKKFDSIIDENLKYYDALDNYIDKFIITEGKLNIEIKKRIVKFEDRINYLHGRNSNNNDFIKLFEEILLNFDSSKYKKLLKEKLIRNEFQFNQNKNIDDLIKDLLVFNWYKYDYIINYDGVEFKDMSQGSKSFVILKLLLEFSENRKPVLIDQPEDSLDNRAIYKELRKYLLDTKKKRQVIVVTHNPNVVVGADSENIIVAHQDSNNEKNKNNKRFQYVNGALENTKPRDKTCNYILESQGIREHIFDVLEGGEEAFSKREQKYNRIV